FLSWVGLRGAVPIVFAILCRASDVPHGHEIFNIVFICTLVSLVVQGTSITAIAKWLKLDEKPEEKGSTVSFDMYLPEEFQSATVEATVSQATIDNHGDRLLDYRMPENISVLMVKRGDQYFVPSGKTQLQPSDCLMIVGDSLESIQQTATRLELQQAKEDAPKVITKVIAEKIEKQIKKSNSGKTDRKKKSQRK
ncbi:MAG: cation:proton antiporter, partial [Bacteroidales bacterium]|nr:cation:proton antiporter [Bacteroidales bacterium]